MIDSDKLNPAVRSLAASESLQGLPQMWIVVSDRSSMADLSTIHKRKFLYIGAMSRQLASKISLLHLDKQLLN